MKKRIAVILLAAMLSALLLPLMSSADQLYIIPDSDRRELTYDELWGYKYDTLM